MRSNFQISVAAVFVSVLGWANLQAAVPNSLILNEANTVSGDSFLEDDEKADSVLGRLQGNGQNWLEFLVVQGDDLGGGSFSDTLDLRGWKFEWNYQKSDTPDKRGNGVMTFTNDPLWAAVPQGTLLTIGEWQQVWYSPVLPPSTSPDPGGGLYQWGGINGLGNQRGDAYDPATPENPDGHTLLVDLPTDTSWNPAVDDWSIHVFGGERNPNNSFKYFSFAGTVTEPDGPDPGFAPDVFTIGVHNEAGIFAVNNDDWRITIKDSAGNVIQGPIGEHMDPHNFGLNAGELLKIEDFAVGSNPTQANFLATTVSSYNDGSSSTFGEANIWSSGGFSQDLSPLRNWWSAAPTLAGDYNGDGFVDAADYTVWRNNLHTNFNLNGNGYESDGSEGVVDDADYTWWKQHYGNSLELGGGGLTSASAPVPEPQTLMTLVFGALGSVRIVRLRRRDYVHQ